MITLKEYKIYLKVKKFIETTDCDENELIPTLVNGVGIIPAYVPLIIESDDMEPTKYYSLLAAARECGLLKQMMVYAYRNRCARITRRKGESKLFRIEWLASPRLWSPAGACTPLMESHLAVRTPQWINLTSGLN